jgi:hypothetical protein
LQIFIVIFHSGTLGVLGVQTTDFCFYNKRYLNQSLKERTLEVDYLIDITPNSSEPIVIPCCPNIASLLSNLLEQLDQNVGKFGDLIEPLGIIELIFRVDCSPFFFRH